LKKIQPLGVEAGFSVELDPLTHSVNSPENLNYRIDFLAAIDRYFTRNLLDTMLLLACLKTWMINSRTMLLICLLFFVGFGCSRGSTLGMAHREVNIAVLSTGRLEDSSTAK
jgi:hypothetical protein